MAAKACFSKHIFYFDHPEQHVQNEYKRLNVSLRFQLHDKEAIGNT
jgi:hypothetical protein